MTPLAPHSPTANGAPPDDLFGHILSANPFTDNRVNGPGPDVADVDDIHRAAFARLTALAREAYTTRRGLGAVLWGEAGVGKSHLLARLGRWADAEGHFPFVYLHNLQASPDGLPRSLLKAVVSTLTLGRVGRFRATPLFRLAAAFAHEACGYGPGVTPWNEIGRAWNRLVDRECASHAALIDRTAHAVLLRFFSSAYAATEGPSDGNAALAVRWLAGDYLDPSEAVRLHLPPGPAHDEPVGLADNQQIKQVLIALMRLAQSAHQPFLMCFDQVDNLDEEQMAALARFLEALLDAAPNLLVVTAGVQATLLHWRQARVIQESAWDRLAQFEVRLQRVSAPEAERIVAVRLARFFEPLRGRAALPPDRLFPLGETWRAEHLSDKADLRPRDVINWAREGFRREQEALVRDGGTTWLATWNRRPGAALPRPLPLPDDEQLAIDRRVARQLAEHKAQRRERPEALPPDADNLAGLVGALLEECRSLGSDYAITAVERPAAKAGARPAFDLLLRRRTTAGEERSWLVFVVTASSVSTAGSLRRLVEAPDPPGRLFLITDKRSPLSLGLKGEEHRAKLRAGCAGQFRHVELTPADCAELDALQAVVGLARSGDLEVEFPGGKPRPLNAAEVIESLHRQGRYRAAPLLRDLLGEPTPAPSATA
jgi:hypothetical protein